MESRGLRVVSFCDGVSCARIALDLAGKRVDYYEAYEIDETAIGIAQARYRDTVQKGSVKTGVFDGFEGIDLLVGGSPCQGFSAAGKRLNFYDERSRLVFEFERFLKEMKPRYFMLENVKVNNSVRDEISRMLGVEPILIDSSIFSAEKRVRYYWTNIPVAELPEEGGESCEELTGDSSLVFCTTRRDSNGVRVFASESEKCTTLTARYAKGLVSDGAPFLVKRGSTEKGMPMDSKIWKRALTVEEAERLHGMPVGYTSGVSKTKAFQVIGNGWECRTVAHIFKGVEYKKDN